LLSPDGEDINVSVFNPGGSLDPKNIFSSPLVGAQGIRAACSFGDMTFYQYEGEGFTIWKSFYDIRRKARVIGRTDQAVLEFTSMYEGSFATDWKDVTTGRLPLKQVQLYFAPYVDNTVLFEPSKQYLTLDVHLTPALLEPYAASFPVLDRFLGQVTKGAPAILFDSAPFTTLQMHGILQSIMAYQFAGPLAARYYDSHVHILLILLLEQLAGMAAPLRTYSPADIERAHEARRLLTTDFMTGYTINQLSRKLGTNPHALKTTFEYLFGTTIGKYGREASLDYARQLVLDTDHTLDEVAMLCSYTCQQNFTTAFKKQFGYTPGWVRTKRKGKGDLL
jgi:AraC family transcriptional activator of pyochelin receptor